MATDPPVKTVFRDHCLLDLGTPVVPPLDVFHIADYVFCGNKASLTRVCETYPSGCLNTRGWFDRLRLPDTRHVTSVCLCLISAQHEVAKVTTGNRRTMPPLTFAAQIGAVGFDAGVYALYNKLTINPNETGYPALCVVCNAGDKKPLCSFDYAFATLCGGSEGERMRKETKWRPFDFYLSKFASPEVELQLHMRDYGAPPERYCSSLVDYLMLSSPNYAAYGVLRSDAHVSSYCARLVDALRSKDADTLWKTAPAELLMGLYGGNVFAALCQLGCVNDLGNVPALQPETGKQKLSQVFTDGLEIPTHNFFYKWVQRKFGDAFTTTNTGKKIHKYVPSYYETLKEKCSVRDVVKYDALGNYNYITLPATTKESTNSKTLYQAYKEKLEPTYSVLFSKENGANVTDASKAKENYAHIDAFISDYRSSSDLADADALETAINAAMFDMLLHEKAGRHYRELRDVKLLRAGFDTVLEYLLATAMGVNQIDGNSQAAPKGLLKPNSDIGEYVISSAPDSPTREATLLDKILELTRRVRYRTCVDFLTNDKWTSSGSCRAWKIAEPCTYTLVLKRGDGSFLTFEHLCIDLPAEHVSWAYAHTDQAVGEYLFEDMPGKMERPYSVVTDTVESCIVNHAIEFGHHLGRASSSSIRRSSGQSTQLPEYAPYLPFDKVPTCSIPSKLLVKIYRVAATVEPVRATNETRVEAVRDLCSLLDCSDIVSVNAVIKTGRVACGKSWWDENWLDVRDSSSGDFSARSIKFPFLITYYRMYYENDQDGLAINVIPGSRRAAPVDVVV